MPIEFDIVPKLLFYFKSAWLTLDECKKKKKVKTHNVMFYLIYNKLEIW